ncbi:MAG: ABC transporter ATP-binding protein [Deltaproteobacteria bacterium]|nr:ABC transporter ATP-binding protein [Deltaproteobacteria bacterium]
MVITCDAVLKVFPPGTRAVDGVSLSLPPRTVALLSGGNGAGKSTLLRCIARLLRPTRGSVRYGWDLHAPGLPPPLTYLGEADYLYGTATVGENLRIAQRLVHAPAQHLEQSVTLWGLDRWWQRPCHELSRGQRRRVALGRAWLVATKVLLLDEPLVGLDPAGAAQFHAAVRAVVNEGRAVIVASQTAEAFQGLLAMEWQMEQGRVVHTVAH